MPGLSLVGCLSTVSACAQDVTPTAVPASPIVHTTPLPQTMSRTDTGDEPAPTTAVRIGWAYGIGAELEYRPHSWGIGASGGYVPGLGPGGYLGAQWGMHSIGRSGIVAEAGVFRGVHNALRVAETGPGLYVLAGYSLVRAEWLSVRGVIGGGLPLGDEMHPVSFELLAKLTTGIVF